MTTDGFVYFIQVAQADERGPIKIGWATDPLYRLGTLQVGNHELLRIVALIAGTVEDERAWQQHFEHDRVRGEWFRWSADLAAALKDRPHSPSEAELEVPPEGCVGINALAECLRASRSTIYRYLKDDTIEGRSVNGRTWVTVESIKRRWGDHSFLQLWNRRPARAIASRLPGLLRHGA